MRKAIIIAAALAATAASAEYSVQFLTPQTSVLDMGKMTEDEFRASPEFKSSTVKGRLLYHTGGFLQFTQGPQWEDRLPSGAHNPTINNDTQNLLLGACFKTASKFGDGRTVWLCRVLNRSGLLESTDHNGTGEFYDGEYNPRRVGSVKVLNGVIQ
jgi:hypothetical protein